MNHRILTRRAGWAAGAALAACLAGCQPAKPEYHPVWPSPPAEPRITHVQNIHQADDLGRPNFFQGLGRLITGDKGVILFRPHGVAVLEGKRIFVTDQELQGLAVMEMNGGRSRLIARMDKDFLVSPVGIVSCGQVLALSDSALRAVFLLDQDGKLLRKIEKPNGFGRPTGLAYDAQRNWLYVSDTLANEICVFDLAGGNMVRRIGRSGTAPGEFNFPTHLCVDGQGRLYVTDSMNFRVQIFDAEGKYIFHIGKQGDASGHLAVPKSVAVDSLGHLYIVDSYFGRVQIFDLQGRFLLAVGEIGGENGMFQVPAGMAIDSKNRIYVCDSFNKRIQVLQYTRGADNELSGETSKKP